MPFDLKTDNPTALRERLEARLAEFNSKAHMQVDVERESMRDTLESLGVDVTEAPVDSLAFAKWASSLDPDIIQKAEDSAKAAQIARAKRYSIGVKDGGNLTMPKQWKDAGCTDADFLDPVNYRYPCHDAEHTKSAASYWGQKDNKDQYTDAEQKVIDGRLDAKRKQFKIGDSNKQYTVEERQALCGITIKRNDAAPPEGYEQYADDPSAWLDFTNYVFPFMDDEAQAKSLSAMMKDAEYSVDEHMSLFNRAFMLQHEATQRRIKSLETLVTEKGDTGSQDPGSQDPATVNKDYMDMYGDVDPEQAFWWSITDLCMSFISACKGLDNLADANGSDLSPDDFNGLADQLTSGLKTLFGAFGQKSLSLKDMETSSPNLFEEWQKAGRRHSAKDQAAISDIHDGAIQLGYDACMPKKGKAGRGLSNEPASQGTANGNPGGADVLVTGGGEASKGNVTTQPSTPDGTAPNNGSMDTLEELRTKVQALTEQSATGGEAQLTQARAELDDVREKASEFQDQAQVLTTKNEDLQEANDRLNAELEQAREKLRRYTEQPASRGAESKKHVTKNQSAAKPFTIPDGTLSSVADRGLHGE